MSAITARASFGREPDPDRAPKVDYVVEIPGLDLEELGILLCCLGRSPQFLSLAAEGAPLSEHLEGGDVT